jgi:hypothetical protein
MACHGRQSSLRSSPLSHFFPIANVLHTSCHRLLCDVYLLAALNATPKLYKPYVAIKLSPIGNGLPLLIALGIEEPASTMEARSASSMPYGCRLRMRRPPRPYYYILSARLFCDSTRYLAHTRVPTVRPAMIDGTEPVLT